MDLYNTNNQNTFVISLDAIDLNYLPTTLNRSYHNKVTPIWTKGNLDLRNDEYFQFEIKNKEDSLSITEEEITDDIIDYMICHICDINVPRPYLNEHNMSVKHKTHKKVIEIALYRTRKNINHEEVTQNVKQNKQVYFCTSCVAVIQLKDKNEHETSVIHKNSVIVDKLLQDFLILYSNNESNNLDSNGNESCNKLTVKVENKDTEDVVQEPNEPKVFHINTNKTSSAVNKIVNKIDVNGFVQNLINDDNINETLKAMSDDDLLQTLININDTFKKSDTDCALRKSKLKTDTQNNTVNSSHVDNMKRFIDIMNKIYCIKIDITVIDSINVQICTIEGSCVKVPADNFLGLKKIDEKDLQCLLCQEVVRTSLKEQHIYDNSHMKKVSTLFKTKHCVRMIDSSWSHCVICNIIVDNSDLHVLHNEEHTRLLEEALVSDVEKIHTSVPVILSQNNPKGDVCDLKHNINKVSEKNTDILWSDKLKTNNDVGRDVNAQMQKAKDVDNINNNSKSKELDDVANSKNGAKYCVICEIDVQSENIEIHLNSTRHKINTKISNLEVHYLLEIVNEEELKCLICLCSVKRNLAAVKRHLLSKNHVKLYNKLLSDNNMRDLKNCRFFCGLCRVQILKMNELSHINGELHQQLMEEFRIVESWVGTTSTNVTANIIDDKKPLDADNQYLCVVCNVQVPNTETCILIHNRGERHLKNVGLTATVLDNTDKNNICSSSTENIQNSSLFELHYHMTLTNQSNPLYCIVCDVNVTLHERNMHEHIKGNNHTTNYRFLLETNQLISDDDKFFCKICSVNIDDKQELIHCKSKKHIKSLELHKKTVSVDNNKSVTITPFKIAEKNEPANLITNVDNKTLDNNNFSGAKTQKDAPVSLKPSATVDINKPSTSTNKLLNTNKSLKRYLLKPTESPNTLMCIVCNVKVPNNEGNIVTYLKGRGHCLNYEAVLKQNHLEESEKYFKCSLCEVILRKGTELDHIHDEQHKLYAEQTQKPKGNSVVENVRIENIYKCSICNVKLTNSDANITEHNTGSQHLQMAKSFTENKLTFKDGAVYCEICELGFPQSEVLGHLETVKHIIEKHFHSS